MRAPLCRQILFVLLAGASATPLLAQNAPLSFEGFLDSTVLTNQYIGVTFSNAIILTAGNSLDEFEVPPHAGTNVASDNTGPMTIVFASPVRIFSGYFTYGVPLSIQAFGSSNNAVGSAASPYSDNEAISGVSGSHANELLQVASAAGIYKVVIAGSAQGASFTVDDIALITRCDVNQDTLTNVNDVQAMVNEALGATVGADDLNADGTVNIVDVQTVINAALSLGCAAK